MTGQRRVIARVLSEAADHPDVEELYRRATALDGRISVATVYRTVRLLEEKGILERRDFGGGRARYEPSEHGQHHHLIDIDTGRVIEFEDRRARARAAGDRQTPRLRPGVAAAGAVRPHSARPGRRPGRPRRRIRSPVPPASRTSRGMRNGTRNDRARKPAGAGLADDDRGSRLASWATRHLRGDRVRGASRSAISAFASRRPRPKSMRRSALRYRIFYDEMGAQPDALTARTRRDHDRFDAVADHLLVVDHELGPGPEGVVGDLSADPQRGGGASSAASIRPTNTTSVRSSVSPAR